MSRSTIAALSALLLTIAAAGAEAPQSPMKAASAPPLVPLARPWSFGGNGGPLTLPGRCDIGMDDQKFADLPPVHAVRCLNTAVPSWGMAYTSAFDVAQYRGKRVRFSGWIKTEDVVPRTEAIGPPGSVASAQGAALYISVSDKTGPVHNTVITGTTPWTYRELVVDLPPGGNPSTQAAFIPMGVSLNGTGQVWVRNLKFEEVSRDTPLTQ